MAPGTPREHCNPGHGLLRCFRRPVQLAEYVPFGASTRQAATLWKARNVGTAGGLAAQIVDQ